MIFVTVLHFTTSITAHGIASLSLSPEISTRLHTTT